MSDLGSIFVLLLATFIFAWLFSGRGLPKNVSAAELKRSGNIKRAWPVLDTDSLGESWG